MDDCHKRKFTIFLIKKAKKAMVVLSGQAPAPYLG
jgi:hypothetical protein